MLEELTVRQNLYYNAKLCLDNNTEEQINKVVDEVLHDLDLYEIKDLKVGKPLNKVISGGQRKRVNIALELIREPSVLFVDEPTSGLSSVDSEMVMNLLREQVFKGKLVIVNIHQPSSNLYKMFDRIIFMDKGGYQIFYGNPSEAVVYFKTKSNHANANEDQCPKCGNREFETDQFAATGGGLTKFMNVQNKKFITVTCTRCKYTEIYKTETSALGNILDFFTN